MFILPAIVGLILPAVGAEPGDAVPDRTCFQTAAPYSPELDIGSDMAIVYGVNGSFPDRVAGWREQGYEVGMMTGIAWGGYGDYYSTPDGFRKEEVQTTKSGRLFMHGNSKTVGYNVPSPAYIEYIKKLMDPAVDAGVSAVFLEEPEYWAGTGWSEGFKKEWQSFYGEPWREPDSSPDAQYRASKLKYELYFNALKEVFAHAEARAQAAGRTVECHVPTHSLINYAQWRIVSPESHLCDIPQLDGYIAQVWTGTARSANVYAGVQKERTFETAYLEYGQMMAMTRPTGRKVWFLADPIEDNPNRSWEDYKRNYECTIIASLMWPDVHRYEVMPWPSRIFRGKYPKVDMDTASDARAGIPADYATQILITINALNDMAQTEVEFDAGNRGIGVVVSDTLMFQRAAPSPSCARLGGFYGLALPLLKVGIPVDVVQLENTIHPGALDGYKVLLLTYEGQKPLKSAYHDALAQWVRDGGVLLYFGDGSDPYHGVREWWNDEAGNEDKAYDDLFRRLGTTHEAAAAAQSVGEGAVRVLSQNPSELQRSHEGGEQVRGLVRDALAHHGASLKTQNHLLIRRGPYVIASVFDESISDEPLSLKGRYVDLFDPSLPVLTERTLAPNERTMLYDLEHGDSTGPVVVAAGARVTKQLAAAGEFRFTTRGPAATTATARVRLPRKPGAIHVEPAVPVEHQWDASSRTLWMSFPNQARAVEWSIQCETN
ncbi:MAG: hypothetical protein GY851_25630 [bacterium]|nr:hypothetical protein [bacterium]